MRATVHIGTIKTGTSSIQRLLYDNRAALLEQGCLYPRSLCHPFADRVAHLASHNPLAVQLAFGWRHNLHAQLRDELAAAPCEHLLISAEALSQFLLTPAQVQSLQRMLTDLGCDDIRIVVWLRESGALFASVCTQQLRDGAPVAMHELPPHACPFGRSILDSRGLLERWAGVFGREQLTVRLFERECFVNGDLLSDAIAAFGLKWDGRFVRPPRINESLNLLETQVLGVVNHLLEGAADVPGGPKALLYAALHRHAGLLDEPQLRFVPRADIMRQWRAWAEAGNEWVRREFFPERSRLFAPVAQGEENCTPGCLSPACWEALGRVLCELARENYGLRRRLRARQ